MTTTLIDIDVLIIGILTMGIGAIVYIVGSHYATTVRLNNLIQAVGMILAILGMVIIVLAFLGPLQANGILNLGG